MLALSPLTSRTSSVRTQEQNYSNGGGLYLTVPASSGEMASGSIGVGTGSISSLLFDLLASDSMPSSQVSQQVFFFNHYLIFIFMLFYCKTQHTSLDLPISQFSPLMSRTNSYKLSDSQEAYRNDDGKL